MTPAIILVLAGAAWRLLRPSVARNVYRLLCDDPEQLSRMIFTALQSKDGRIKFRAYWLETFADCVMKVDGDTAEALRIASANQDALEALAQIQKLQGAQLSDVVKSVRDIPQLSESLRQLSNAMETFAKEMKVVNDTMIRQEERERVRAEERRLHQTTGGPRRRSTD